MIFLALEPHNKITYHEYTDISFAVATKSGLLVPVLRNVESL